MTLRIARDATTRAGDAAMRKKAWEKMGSNIMELKHGSDFSQQARLI
jgi:hypothetical protein